MRYDSARPKEDEQFGAVCRDYGIGAATFERWQNPAAGMSVSEAQF